MGSLRLNSQIAALLVLGLIGCSGEVEPKVTIDRGSNLPPSVAAPESAPPAEVSEAVAKPNKPLALSAPPVPSSMDQGIDLSKADSDALHGRARELASEGNPKEAARYQYWAVHTGEGGAYDLACWTALAGDVNGAFYWLQEAALDDGVDVAWAGRDPDLDSLRRDPRWRQIAPFLKKCNDYWTVNGPRQTLLVLPDGYQKGTPIGVLIGMHGMGDQPGGYADPESFGPLASELNMAIVGVSGTVAKGRRSFVWSEDPKADARRIHQALEEVADRVTVKPGHLIAFGFSQGAQMGFEVAFQNPGEFKGAIVMSPGTTHAFGRLDGLRPVAANKSQGFVFLCGAGEQPGNVFITKENAEFARKAGSKVELKLYEGMNQHAFPPDFRESFTRWVRFIDGSGSESKVE